MMLQDGITTQMSDNNNKVIVIGAGPVGLSAAILLAKTNKFSNIDVYESRLEIPAALRWRVSS